MVILPLSRMTAVSMFCGVVLLLFSNIPVSAAPVAGMTILTPADGAVVRPGETVRMVIEVDPALPAAKLEIFANMRTRIPDVPLTAPPYEADITLPIEWTGPLELMTSLTTTDGELLEGPSVTLSVIPGEPPERLEVDANRYIQLFTGEPISISRHTVRVSGHYAGGVRRDLGGSGLGTTYTSSDPAVATVDSGGVVSPVAPGIAYVIVEHQGRRDYAEVTVNDPAGVPLAPIDHTPHVAFTAGGFRKDPESGDYVQQLTLRNDGPLPFAEPLNLVITGLPADVFSNNNWGVTETVAPLGSPYVVIDLPMDMRFFPPGYTTTVALRFRNRNGVPITYTPKVVTAMDP